MYIFVCQDTLDGIFTGIYEAYARKLGLKNIQLACRKNQDLLLFGEYITINADSEKSARVGRTILKRLGADFYETICYAALAEDSPGNSGMDKADAVYRTVVMGLSLPSGAGVLDSLAQPCIHQVFTLYRSAFNEAHHYTGFLRFRELVHKILFADFHPRNHILPFIAEHFTDRFPMENFIIYDRTHQLAAVHSSGKDYLIADASMLDPDKLSLYSEDEMQYQKLWHTFFHHIAIDTRKNSKLQRQNMPKRFQMDALEFEK